MASDAPHSPPTASRRDWKRIAGIVVGLVIALGALGAFRAMAHELTLASILQAVRSTPRERFIEASVLVVCNYGLLTLYDLTGLRYLGHKIGYWRSSFVSFAAFALGNVLGSTVFVGGALRYHLYGKLGVPVADRMVLIGYVTGTASVGILVLAAAAVAVQPALMSDVTHLHPLALRLVAAGCAGLLALYWTAAWRRWPLPGPIRGRLSLPSGRVAVAQTVIAAAEWMSVAGVFYLLLPEEARPGFFGFLAMYVASYWVGVLSNVPGGLGVLEVTLAGLLRPYTKPDTVLAAALLFRMMLHLVPFGIASTLLAGAALRERTRARTTE